MARRRDLALLSLSFLDVMAAGLGAVALIFLIINHAVDVRATQATREPADGVSRLHVSRLEDQVLKKRQAVAALERTLREVQDDTQQLQAQAGALSGEAQPKAEAAPPQREQRQRIAALEAELKSLETQVRTLRERKAQEEADEKNATRRYVGEGDRQYVTGLKVGGRHILILVDASASMLDEKIVDIILRRNMDAARKTASPKWQRALDSVDWIAAQVPPDAHFQLYTFNTRARPVLPDSADQWQAADGGRRLTAAVRALREVVPGEGTSLHQAFAVAGRLQPRPDNLYLITDGLPTQGATPGRKGSVSGDERLRLYLEALKALPRGVPVNTILFPIEGDPMAASAFWQLAYLTGGSFISPSRDWP